MRTIPFSAALLNYFAAAALFPRLRMFDSENKNLKFKIKIKLRKYEIYLKFT